MAGKKERHECIVLAVNDGGHRSLPQILEFKLGKFRTSSDTVFITEKGNTINIGHRNYEEIADEFPEAIEQFEDYCLLLTIQWNLNAKSKKRRLLTDRNEVYSCQRSRR